MFVNFNKAFFETLIFNLKNIDYCIVGDHEQLPDCIAHDLDIWTADRHAFYGVFTKTVRETGFHLLIHNETSNGLNLVVFKKIDEEICLMKLDVLTDCSYRSLITLASDSTFRNNRKPVRGFCVANNTLLALVHLLYPLLEWGRIEDKYKDQIMRYCTAVLFVQTLQQIFGQQQAEFILHCIHYKQWGLLAAHRGKFRRKAIIRFFSKPNIRLLRKLFWWLHFNLKRLVKPSGYGIVFCGLDGAGKTTIVDILNHVFTFALKDKKVHLGYWRPFVLPELKTLMGKSNERIHGSKGCGEENHNVKPRGRLTSLFKLMYYWLDYLLGRVKFIGMRNRGGIVMFDRYYVDMIVYPQRFNMNLPGWLLRFFHRLCPSNDLTFFLWAEPRVIRQRKKEFTRKDILSQTNQYFSEGRLIRGFTPIETIKPLVEEIEDILNAMSKYKFHA